ncbi:hypothetical protein [uncultured Draconibacterium sp.]|uniref:hypothetical protein n=1 Tax=uncultured Draconibacterium sp. TaxID=1573823 RepID=UPI002AA62B39|nr:hypothetical protein [uncultured Draconibacterium sp.]
MTKIKNFLHLFAFNSRQNINKFIFIILATVLLLTMCIISKDAGINVDEHFHVDHAENVLKYYSSFGKDKTALYNEKTLHLYGQSLDNIVHFFNQAFNIDDIYRTRHLFGSIVGWILLLFTALIAVELFGWQAGYIALLFMFFSPRIVGHAFNNLKDIPFAAAYIFTIYFFILFLKQLPKLKFNTLLFIALGIAWAISIRIGGVILIPYFFMVYGLYYLLQKDFYKLTAIKNGLKIVGILLGVSIVAYLLGLVLWPYALQNPVKNPFLTLRSMTNYGMNLNQLFEGKMIPSASLPWYYGIKYILISSPIVVEAGLIIFLLRLIREKNNKITYLAFFFLFFAFIFPLGYTIYKHSNLYSGWRHLLWIYSPLVVLSAGGFAYLIQSQTKWIKYGAGILLAALLANPVIFSIKNHPYQYTYFNELVGGIKGAYGLYEMDPYYHSLKEGAKYLEENGYLNDTVTVVSNSDRVVTDALYNNTTNVNITYSRFHEKNKNDWDYAIWANTLIPPKQLAEGYWPPKGTIYTIDVDGVPIGAVVKRLSFEDLKGFEALFEDKFDEAILHFNNFLKVYPESEEVWEGLAIIYKIKKDYNTALEKVNKAIDINPGLLSAYIHKAEILNNLNEYNNALAAANVALSVNPTIYEGSFQKGIALKHLNNPQDAIRSFQNTINSNNKYYRAYHEIGEILINYKNFDKATGIYNQLLKVRNNDMLALIGLAKCYIFMNNSEMAVKMMQRLPQNSFNHIEVIKLQCRLAIRNNDMKQAAFLINRFNDNKTDSELYVIRALFETRSNNISAATNDLEKAVELDPLNLEAAGMLKTLNKLVKNNNQTNKNAPSEKESIMFQNPKQDSKQNPLRRPSK